MRRGESVSAVQPRLEAGRSSGDSKSRKDRDWPIPLGRLEKEQREKEKEREKETARAESKEKESKDAHSPVASRQERGLSNGASAIKAEKLSPGPPVAANFLLMSSPSGPYASTREHKDKSLASGKNGSQSHQSFADREIPV